MSIDITVSGLNTEIDITLATQPETIIADIGEFTIIDREAYTGAYVFTPTEDTQTVEIKDRAASENITINPIPSNYGLITWNGTTLTVS